MKEYFKHNYPLEAGLSCTLRIADMRANDKIYPAIQLEYAQDGRKKTSFAILKDMETGEDLIPKLAECFKSLAEAKKDVKIVKCSKCKGDFEKTHPAQKNCVHCRPKKKGEPVEVATIGDKETKNTVETKEIK